MRAFLAAAAVFSILRLGPCDGGGGGGGAGTTPPADPAKPPAAGGGTGGRCKATGTLCPAFVSKDGWEFRVATSYSAGNDPKVSSMAGKAVFNADGTFVEDYTIGSVPANNHYEGTYTLDGRSFTGKTTAGETLEYVLACDEALKELVLTFPNEDAACTPSLVLGLKLIEK